MIGVTWATGGTPTAIEGIVAVGAGLVAQRLALVAGSPAVCTTDDLAWVPNDSTPAQIAAATLTLQSQGVAVVEPPIWPLW